MILELLLLAQATLPEGPGKDAVQDVCTECHTADRIVAQRHTEEVWRNVMREMMENGAAFNADDTNAILAYLTKNFGPKKVNVNQASAKELAETLKLTPAQADAIVKYRTENGQFRNLADFQKLKIEANKDQLEF